MSQNYLIHIGNKNSGRYPRGSGENPRYGSIGRKMKRSEIKSVARNISADYDKKSVKATNEYLRKHYKTDNIDKLSDSQVLKGMQAGNKKTVDGYLAKYGKVNYKKIMKKANVEFLPDGGILNKAPKDHRIAKNIAVYGTIGTTLGAGMGALSAMSTGSRMTNNVLAGAAGGALLGTVLGTAQGAGETVARKINY